MNIERFKELVDQVVLWGEARGLTDSNNAVPQAAKTISESSELLDACITDDYEEIIDGIGDVLVTLILQCEVQSLSLDYCLNHAYNQIKNRTGKTINGTFIKDE